MIENKLRRWFFAASKMLSTKTFSDCRQNELPKLKKYLKHYEIFTFTVCRIGAAGFFL